MSDATCRALINLDMQEHAENPTVDLQKKKGRGIYRRRIHWVPASGEGAVNKRVATAETVKGSSR